jgi:hypothetical protein
MVTVSRTALLDAFKIVINAMAKSYREEVAKHTPMENHMGSDLPLTKTKEDKK